MIVIMMIAFDHHRDDGDNDDGDYAAGVIIMQPQWLITSESARVRESLLEREILCRGSR